jgi:paraquat-inducible protein B
MSKPANKTLIGIFVVGAIALTVVAIVVLGSGKFFRKTFKAVCFFEGSVGGLDVGAPVVFNGVRIGGVTDVVLRYDTRDLTATIPVYIKIDPQRVKTVGPRPTSFEENLKLLIDRGLRARLESQSILTGQMQVALDFHPDRPARFVGIDTKYLEIPTIPTPLQELTRRIEQLPLEQIVKDIGSAVAGINRFVNSAEITKSLRSVSAAAEETKNLIGKLDAKIDPLVLNIEATVKDAQKLLENIDRQVEPLGPSIQKASDSIEKTLKSAEAALHSAQKAIDGVEGTISEDSPLAYQLNKTLEEVSNLARSVRRLADYLERHPESVLRGKGGGKE